jgi:hypothetical protein
MHFSYIVKHKLQELASPYMQELGVPNNKFEDITGTKLIADY